jgi:diacylglycerol kinase (CTP)
MSQSIDDIAEESDGPKTRSRRSRTRSRSPISTQKITPLTSRRSSQTSRATDAASKDATNGKSSTSNGHLAPPQTGWNWRDFSRSPSPLGLIPIHRHWRTFVHKHEVPRKVLHVSIGFFVIWLYLTGTQTSSVAPYLMTALIPIAATDWLRHRYASVNRFYVRALGALMRETEYAGWNGVVFYLLGAWIVLYFFPKDVGVVSVLLLSWCDTAASTFGRLWGRYTPRIRRGKSLAGSLAAFVVGVATSWVFYGWLVPKFGPMPGDDTFMFKGVLSLPRALVEATGLPAEKASITGPLALGVMSLWSGFVASASEVVDVFGWDDNLTIPVLSGIGIWGFLKFFSLS